MLCSGYRCKPEGSLVSGWVVYLCPRVQEILVLSGIGVVLGVSPVILVVSEYLKSQAATGV